MNKNTTKILLSLVTFFVLSMGAYAQPLSHYGQRIFFGVRSGVNLASIDGEYNVPEFVSDQFEYKTRLTGHFGLLLNYYVGSGLAFQGEVNYSMMGADVENNRQGVTVQALNFIELPAIIRYYAGRPKRPQFYIEAGPVAKIALIANDHYGDRLENAKEQYRGASYGVMGGLGLQFYAKKYRVLVGGRYTMGFTDMNEFERVTNRMRAISIGITVMKDIFYYF